MPITTGTRLGPYEIVSPIGAGGMGEVYKARDTRLDRSVAIKVLPPAFADNVQLKLRFEREAKTISQLTHPNICTLYDVGNERGVEYLVMELLDGTTLGDRIARGPLPMRDVLRYGREIAAALDRAHRAGVVHRDLKPGNVMITKSGAKLLDFGLAKGGSIEISPDGATQQKSLTQEGTILGTFQYMAPEQLEGIEADARTDIFALGAVLYEMATGRRAFDGKTKTSLIAAIVGGEPKPIREIQPLTPPAFEHVVAKCLAKDPDQRWQSASDVASELDWIGGATSVEQSAGEVTRRKSRRRTALMTMIALAVVAAAIAASFLLRKPAAETPMILSIAMPQHRPFDAFHRAALSPDGNTIVFVADMIGSASSASSSPALWLRAIDRAEPRLLPGTQGADEPFWSPDGTSIGFFANGKLKRIAVNGGPAQVICDAPVSHGGSWNRDGVIIFCGDDGGPLYRVDARGGAARPLTQKTAKEEAHRWPSFLPDGEHFLFLGDAPKTEDHHLKIGSLRDGSSRDLIQAVTNAMYAEPGQLLYVRAGSLLAQPFDLKTLTLSGEPRVIAEQVIENDINHHFEFSASQNGRLIYRSGSPDSQLTWLDRTGKVLGTIGEARRIGNEIRIAPDQQHVIAEQNDADGRSDDLWTFDVTRGVASRFTFDPAADRAPAWSPDGTKVAFSSMRTGIGDLYVTETATPSNVRKLGATEELLEPTCWSRDGESVLADHYKKTDSDILTVSTRTGETKPYISTRFNEGAAALSPDNVFISYASDESGRSEIYVERYPTHASRRQISTAGGVTPLWRGDSRELFYVALGGEVMSVDMTSEAATPKPLFRLPGFTYDVTRDGQRFIVDQPVDDTTRTPLTFVSSWMGLRR
jgi:serine/threonine protein kinase/Tol biopolymer transport system component